MFVSSVFDFLPWCNSKSVFFNPVCTVNRITRSARFTLSVKLFPSSMFAITKIFNICSFYRSVSRMYSECTILNFCIPAFTEFPVFFFQIKAPPLSDLIFFRYSVQLKLLDIVSFIFEVLKNFYGLPFCKSYHGD